MTWICERKAQENDLYKLEKSAVRFIDRHKIQLNRHQNQYHWFALEDFLNMHSGCGFIDDVEYYTYLRRLWIKCLRRALSSKDATSIAYGYIGCSE